MLIWRKKGLFSRKIGDRVFDDFSKLYIISLLNFVSSFSLTFDFIQWYYSLGVSRSSPIVSNKVYCTDNDNHDDDDHDVGEESIEIDSVMRNLIKSFSTSVVVVVPTMPFWRQGGNIIQFISKNFQVNGQCIEKWARKKWNTFRNSYQFYRHDSKLSFNRDQIDRFRQLCWLDVFLPIFFFLQHDKIRCLVIKVLWIVK